MSKIFKKFAAFGLTALLLFVMMPVHAEAPEISFYQITNNDETSKYESNISGNHFVWRERNDNDNYSIYLADISDPESILRYEITADGRSSDVYGDILIWGTSDQFQSTIYLANISDPSNITPYSVYTLPVPGNIGTIAIQGSYVYWSDNRNGSYDIFMADVSDPENPVEYPVTGDIQGDQSGFRLDGNIIVWYEDSSGDYDVSFADITDPENINITPITIAGSDQRDASVYSNYIVWGDIRDGETSIYLYNIENSNQQKLLSLGDAEITSLDIVNSSILWTQFSDDYNSSDIYKIDFEESSTPINLTAGLEGYDYYFLSGINETGNKFGINAYGETDHIFMGVISQSDTTPPTLETLPGDTRVVNLTEDELITTNPYTIRIKPTDDTAIEKVEFYVDDVLICTDTTPDDDGVYSCAWDTSKYHSDIRIVAYDTSGNTVELLRSVSVDPSLYTLPRTGMNLWDYLRYLVSSLRGLIS